MPVVINEFEVVPESSQQRADTTAGAAEAKPNAPKPADIELLLAHQRARDERVRAY
jgi:hypothetical protein